MKPEFKSKQKMQNVSFKSVEEFLEFLPDDELKIVELLRTIILDCIPDVTEKLSYSIPFYKRHKNICFIWPASVIWGNKKSYSGVRLGFSCGYLMNDEINYLDKGNRKQVSYIDFTDVNQVDITLLKSYIFDAVMIDEQLHQSKKRK